MKWLGAPVAEIRQISAYSCRGMNGQPGAHISEHAFGNALDIGGFELADGRTISVVRDWSRGDDDARAFLMDVHAGSCRHFSTVLAPGSNPFHYNHIHVDLALRGRTGRSICRPTPYEVKAPAQLIAKGPSEEDGADAGDDARGAAVEAGESRR
jgi:hypothetical protein